MTFTSAATAEAFDSSPIYVSIYYLYSIIDPRREFPLVDSTRSGYVAAMTLGFLILLALVQGVTEFLPVSSSAHLVLAPVVTGQPDQGLAIDAAVHVGTLLAVVLYFRADALRVVYGALDIVMRKPGRDARLTALLALSTIPVVIAGAFLKFSGLAEQLRSIEVIGWMTVIWGIALWLADKTSGQMLEADDWNWRHALAMGGAQAIALIPGVSRSGITITAARSLGYERVDAARLSMLMSIPTIIAAGALLSLDIAEGGAALGTNAAIACLLSFLSALAALAVMMRMLRTWTMTPFVIYRLALGAVLLWFAYYA